MSISGYFRGETFEDQLDAEHTLYDKLFPLIAHDIQFDVSINGWFVTVEAIRGGEQRTFQISSTHDIDFTVQRLAEIMNPWKPR